MKIIRALYLLMPFLFSCAGIHAQTDADWVIVGAGPAGIAAVGVLIDIGINQERITWLDAEFNVGRLSNYGNVPANNKTGEFIEFVNACDVFQECSCAALDALHATDPEHFDTLGIIVEPLKCITELLRTKVTAVQDSMTGLYHKDNAWHITTANNQHISADHVVLATGCRPRTLHYGTQEVIPLDVALDPANLQEILSPQDTVAVIGDSHSAILLLKFIYELPFKVTHLYNFYKHDLIYAINMGDWMLNSFTGLKGPTAEWARTVLEKEQPESISRIESTPETLKHMLPHCTKTIYAIGYERNPLPTINGKDPLTDYNEHTGTLAPKLFGIGLAFPEPAENKIGQHGYCIGLDCFMDYAHAMIPQWLSQETLKDPKRQRARAQLQRFKKMKKLFTVCTL